MIKEAVTIAPIHTLEELLDDPVVQTRMQKIASKIFDGMEEMELSSYYFPQMGHMPIPKIGEIQINFDLNKMAPSPEVVPHGDQMEIIIPLLFLVEGEDFKRHPELSQLVFDSIHRQMALEAGDKILNAYVEFIKDPELAAKGRDFVLYHEIAHILLDHAHTRLRKSPVELRQDEMVADLAAAATLHDVKGGVYLFEAMEHYGPKEATSQIHPRFRERIDYLKQFAPILEAPMHRS